MSGKKKFWFSNTEQSKSSPEAVFSCCEILRSFSYSIFSILLMLLLSSQRVLRPTYSSRPSIAWKPLWCKYKTVFRRGVMYKLFWRQCSCNFTISDITFNIPTCTMYCIFFLLEVQLPCRYLRNVSNYINNILRRMPASFLPSKTSELFYVDPLFDSIFAAHSLLVNSSDVKSLAF